MTSLCPCFLSDLHNWAGMGLQGFKSGLVSGLLCDAPGAAELGLGFDAKCG